MFEESIRRTWFNPEKLLEDIGLSLGMTFMDIGSGNGFFTILASRIVGNKGEVYAVDIDSLAIERLKQKASETGLANVKASVGEAEKTVLCEKCADIIFYSIVLHDFREPLKVLLNAKKMLKPSGRLIDLDWKKKRMPFGPPARIRFSERQASALIQSAGFKIEKTAEIGRYHYMIKARL